MSGSGRASVPGIGARHLVRRGRRVAALLLLSGFTALLPACGGGGDDGAPAGVGQTAARLVDGAGYPGAVALRLRPDGSQVKAAGVLKVGGAAAAEDRRFPVGSLTKAMTATLAAVLVQEGRIAWDSRLLDVLPELAGGARDVYGPVTLRDLLAHRGGIFAAADADQLAQLPPFSGTAMEQRLQFTAWALGRPPAVQPGRQTEYSNGGYLAAAAMLERAAGRVPYETLMQQKVFQPLGMAPAFGTPGAGGDGEAWGHVRNGTAWSPLPPDTPGAGLPEAANPAGGVKLSGQDLARFLQLHLRALRGDTGLLITPQSAQMLHQAVQDGYALGWAAGTDSAGHALSYYTGSDDTSYYAVMALRPDVQRAAAVMVNAYGDTIEADASAAVDALLR